MPGRTKRDEKDRQFAMREYADLKRRLTGAEMRMHLHEAARSNGKRPPKHVRGISK